MSQTSGQYITDVCGQSNQFLQPTNTAMPRRTQQQVNIREETKTYLLGKLEHGEPPNKLFKQDLHEMCIDAVSKKYPNEEVVGTLNAVNFGRLLKSVYPNVMTTNSNNSSVSKDTRRFITNMKLKIPSPTQQCSQEATPQHPEEATHTDPRLTDVTEDSKAEHVKYLEDKIAKLQRESKRQKSSIQHLTYTNVSLRIERNESYQAMGRFLDASSTYNRTSWMATSQFKVKSADYNKESILGEGSFGTVYKSSASLDPAAWTLYALKEFKRGLATAHQELRSLITLGQNRRIQQLHGFDLTDKEKPVIITHLITSAIFPSPTTMKTALASKEEHPINFISHILCLIHSVEYVHSMGLLHNDIKTDNYVLSGRDDGVLIDFGMATTHSKPYKRSRPTTQCSWMAPEISSGELATSTTSDVYSVGYFAREVTKARGIVNDKLKEVYRSCMQQDRNKRPPLTWCRVQLV
ncbi:unnamed protein product [Owenia fusiformis]|uniref:Uncharacterized protein n=1 Tax=Owenia fusiformis TaxID=6347 RepID=A0A8J1USU9_OWEFU|nr:unnamed protein product [Owenia fusiformis]